MKYGSSRPYEMRKRANQIAQTRDRIVEATVRLHTSVGPARTTIAAIAREAGVTRATVYSHFADDTALFIECSGRWALEHPQPDIAVLAAIEDPAERAAVAFGELYRWFAANAAHLRLFARDKEAIPNQILARRLAGEEAAASLLLAGWTDRAPARRRRSAVARHLVRFTTWESLTNNGEMNPTEAADLATALLRAASPARRSGSGAY